MNATKLRIDENNTTHGDDIVGFVYAEGFTGGYFFTWLDTLSQTIESLREDTEEETTGLDEVNLDEYLREHLPATKMGRSQWGRLSERLEKVAQGVGRAMARDYAKNGYGREWAELSAEDGDRFLAAGLEKGDGTPLWDLAEAAAKEAFEAELEAE